MTWKPALTAAGTVPTGATGMHELRHFYASALLDAGESIKALPPRGVAAAAACIRSTPGPGRASPVPAATI
ncbi:hypothetical protein [Micromonospora sp. NPDC093277]|uniref:hypothetical protein n=1 Tax=Micromonospora sp. NPDC093277 TaxID=3364291 RepID=UPI003805158D